MSIFSINLVEETWVGMAYKFWNCTNPNKSSVWDDILKLNFSRDKLKEKVKELLLREDGTMKISESEFQDMNDILENHSVFKLSKEYIYIILICLVAPTLNENDLSKIFTSCLKQTQLRRGSDVAVTVKFPESEHCLIFIKANTTTPQTIGITLKRK